MGNKILAVLCLATATLPAAGFSQTSSPRDDEELSDVPTVQATYFTRSDGQVYSGMLILSEAAVPSDSAAALQSPRVHDDLELTSEQRERINEKLRAINADYAAEYQGLIQKDPSQRSPEVRERIVELDKNKKLREDELMQTVLLPHQAHRLKQLIHRSRMTNNPESIGEAELQNELQLTEEQKSELKSKFAEMQREMAKEVNQLRKKKTQAVLESVLKKDQLKKLESLLGEETD